MPIETFADLRSNVREVEGLVHRLLGDLCVGSRYPTTRQS